MNILHSLFHSKVRAEVFRLLFGLHQEKMYLNQLRVITGFASRSIEEELAKLKALELVVSTRDRSRVYYEANQAHPLFPEIHLIVLKTTGLKDIIQQALPETGIDFAFIFGSFASDQARATSDVDLLTIGSVGHRELASPLARAGEQLGRVVNPHCLTRVEFQTRLATHDHFLHSILLKPKLFVFGNDNEFKRLVECGLVATPPDEPRGNP